MGNDAGTVIIGGGIAGLTAAAYLARAGHPVTVLEGAGTLGGRARTRLRSGFAFNLGAHALMNHGAGLHILRELGIAVAGRKAESKRPLALVGGEVRDLPSSPSKMLTSDLLSWRGRLEMARFFLSLRSAPGKALNSQTVADWLDSRFHTLDARQFIGTLVRLTTYCSDERQSAAAARRQVKGALADGVLYLDNGWQAMVDSLASYARRHGAVLKCGSSVRSFDGTSVQLTTGERIRCQSVIIAVQRNAAATLLGPGAFGEDSPPWIPVRAACLNIGLSSLPVKDRLFAIGIDQPYYYSVHSAWAKLAPRPGAVIHVMKYLAPDARCAESELEQVMDLVQPGWRDRLVHKEFMPDLAVCEAIPVDGRPDVDALGLPGVYIAGDWVGQDAMLSDAAFATGKRAAELLLKQKEDMASYVYESVA